MSDPPAPSWPVAAGADPNRRPLPVVLACLVGVVWSLAVLGWAARFGLQPTTSGWRHADPTGLLPHGLWWRVGAAAFYAAWCGLGIWFAVAAYGRRSWAGVALFVSAVLVFLLTGYELRAVADVVVPSGALASALLLALPGPRAWYAARQE